MNEAIVTEYVKLCTCLTALDADAEQQLYVRLDQLWYAEMTDDDRSEADRRLFVQDAKTHSWHGASYYLVSRDLEHGDLGAALAGYGCGVVASRPGVCNGYPARVQAFARRLRAPRSAV